VDPGSRGLVARRCRRLVGVPGGLVQKTGLSAGGAVAPGGLERPVVALEDTVGEYEVVAADEVDVLDDEG